jgi:hypothetical protein
MEGSCDHSNEHSASIQTENLISDGTTPGFSSKPLLTGVTYLHGEVNY